MVSNTCVYLNSGTPNFLLQSHASNRKQLWRDNLKINSDRPIKPGMNDSIYAIVSYSVADPGPFFRGIGGKFYI